MSTEDSGRKVGHLETVDDDQGKKARWKVIGPGLVVAATGVGAADMVATLAAGSRYGYTLLWAVIVGVLLKIVLVEGAGRYTLATGYTIFEGWRSLGRWTTWYFGALHHDLGLRLRRLRDVLDGAAPRGPLPAGAVDCLGDPHGPARLRDRVVQPLRRLREDHRRAGRHHVRQRRGSGHHRPAQRAGDAHRPGAAHPRGWPRLHPCPGRRRRRHDHPGRLRLLAAGEGVVHTQVDEGHAHRQLDGLRAHRHLRHRDAHRRRGGRARRRRRDQCGGRGAARPV